jgi:phosphate acetyltransferase
MADRRQITGGIVDGPLAFDNAVSEEAVKIKSIASPVAGRADILIVPDLGLRQAGLRAQLRMQTFVTGVLYVALDLRPDTPIVLRKLDPRVPELPTIPTDIEIWTAKLERFAATIEKVPLE